MRTKNYWQAALFCMAALLTASCSHDDDGYWDFPPAGLPDYSYFRTGWDQESLQIDSSATAQTVFSYRSWAEAATIRRTETSLQAALENVNTEVTVNDFIIGTPQSALDYQAVQSRRERNVTITDSLMIYRQRYRNFTLEYRMPFQSAFYNDGKTSGQMAHLRFSPQIRDHGYTVSDLKSETENGSVFMRKLFRHSISVCFNGKDYQATATVILKRRAGSENEDFVVKSALVGSGIKNLSNQGNHASYTSWLKVRQTFNSGKQETLTFEVLMYGIMTMQPLTSVRISGKTLIREGGGFDDGATHVQTVARNKYVDALYYERPYTVTYNFGTVTTVFQHVEAFYNDGFAIIEFPCIKYAEIKDDGSLKALSHQEDQHGSYGEYLFSHTVTAKFKSYAHSEKNSIQAIVTD